MNSFHLLNKDTTGRTTFDTNPLDIAGFGRDAAQLPLAEMAGESSSSTPYPSLHITLPSQVEETIQC